jgi:hypothetical protein
MKLMQSLERIENKLDKESGSNKSGSHRSPDEERREGVVADITNTPKGIPIGEHTTVQVHPLPGSIGGLGWMN